MSKRYTEEEKVTIRAEIIDAARRIMGSSSFEKITLLKIAQETKFTRSAIITCTGSLEEILVGVQVCVVEELGAQLARAAEGCSSPAQVISKISSAYLLWATKNPYAHQLAFRIFQRRIRLRLEVTEKLEAALDPLRDAVSLSFKREPQKVQIDSVVHMMLGEWFGCIYVKQGFCHSADLLLFDIKRDAKRWGFSKKALNQTFSKKKTKRKS